MPVPAAWSVGFFHFASIPRWKRAQHDFLLRRVCPGYNLISMPKLYCVRPVRSVLVE